MYIQGYSRDKKSRYADVSYGSVHVRLGTDLGEYSAQTVTTSATIAKVIGVDEDNIAATWLHNVSDTTVYFGYDSSVTTSNGIPLYSGDSAYRNAKLYVIAGANKELRVENILSEEA